MKALLSRQISLYLGITPAACANAGRRQLPTSQILTGILERRGNQSSLLASLLGHKSWRGHLPWRQL